MREYVQRQNALPPSIISKALRNLSLSNCMETNRKELPCRSDKYHIRHFFSPQQREKLRIKGATRRINNHVYIDGDDAEMCSHCLAVESLPVPLQDMNLNRTGRKATCPHCKMSRGNGPPISRQ